MQQGVDVWHPPFDGPANHVRHVVEALQRRGHQVRLLARLEGRIGYSDGLGPFQPVTVRHSDGGPLRWLERAVRRLQATLRLPYAGLFESIRFAQACRQELTGCDLLYERKSWMTYGGVLAARWMGIPLVLEENGDNLLDLEAKGQAPTGLQRRLSLAVMGWAMRGAAHVVASGEGWREQFIRRWGVDPSRVTTVENGTVLVELLSREQLRSFRLRRAPQDPATLAYVGGFYPWHGVTHLLRAFARTHRRFPQARLLMVGYGAGYDEARQLAHQLGIGQAVTFTGQLAPEAYAPRLAQADIGLSPYCGWPEFSGLKVLDYKAAGLATIASGHGKHPLTLRHGVTGWIVPPCDEDALAGAMAALLADPELCQRLGQAARQEAEVCHTWERTVDRLLQVFQQVLAQKSDSMG
ncbi:MAG: glycosyltransferase WbuB [Litorilinea sp.]|nr:MAG: glycosyltransferase WbuB [Litorilinea sp.]